MDFFIKNLGIVISSFYYYFKLSKVRLTSKHKIFVSLMVILLPYLLVFIDKKNTIITMPILLLLFCFYLRVIMINDFSFVLAFISFAISYVIFILSASITSVIVYYNYSDFLDKYSQWMCILIQINIMRIPFFFKRTKDGMEFLKESNKINIMFVLSLCIFYLSICLNKRSLELNYKIGYFFALVLLCLVFIYWPIAITRHYLERLSLRNIDSLNAELVEKTNYIKELEEDKARIEKLNHKNYKLVPAMEGAVMHYLDGVKSFVESNADNPAFAEFAASKEMDMTGFIDEGNRLLGELNKMLAEWEDIVHNDDIDGKKDLPVCGVTRVDYILSYMYERSLKENFVLKVDVDSELTGLTEKIITDEDLGTLIADLIENAIIATRYNNGKDILVRLGMMKKEYTIEVYDSGIPFDKEVLAKYGYEQITTHADDSGSGIGMMQTYEILSKCGASLFIDEFAEGEGMYTKRISVVFNKKHQYVLYTKRSDEEVAYLKKRSDLMIVRK